MGQAQRTIIKERRAWRVPQLSGINARSPERLECPKCKGSGKTGRKPTHKPDCACIACRPCSQCKGRGWIEGEEHRNGRERKEVDVRDERDAGITSA